MHYLILLLQAWLLLLWLLVGTAFWSSALVSYTPPPDTQLPHPPINGTVRNLYRA
jgi:hypothetical protein